MVYSYNLNFFEYIIMQKILYILNELEPNVPLQTKWSGLVRIMQTKGYNANKVGRANTLLHI